MTATDTTIEARLEYLRQQIGHECISMGEIAELHDLREHIPSDDVILLEWAGVPEFPEEEEFRPRTFRGTEIAYEMVISLASLPSGIDIVELSAGENMEIKITLADEMDGQILGFYTQSWNGAVWGPRCPLI